MRRIIVNADDFGYNDVVNEAIINGIERGYITSSTIMASGVAFDRAVEYAKQNPKVSFGVHLCIDEFFPLTSKVVFEEYGLTDASGRFIKFGYMNLRETNEIKQAIYHEWKSQLLKVRNAGVSISHLDSHHHAHTFSFLYEIVEALSKEFLIDKVRISLHKPLWMKVKEKPSVSLQNNTELLSCQKRPSRIKALKNNFEMGLLDNKLKRSFHTTDFFCPLRFYIANKSLLSRYETIELMTHPGLPQYQNETDLLPLLRQDESLSFISYIDL